METASKSKATVFKATAKRDADLLAIAKSECWSVETLETRNMDSLDFHSLSAATIKSMLDRAYQAGLDAAKK